MNTSVREKENWVIRKLFSGGGKYSDFWTALLSIIGLMEVKASMYIVLNQFFFFSFSLIRAMQKPIKQP